MPLFGNNRIELTSLLNNALLLSNDSTLYKTTEFHVYNYFLAAEWISLSHRTYSFWLEFSLFVIFGRNLVCNGVPLCYYILVGLVDTGIHSKGVPCTKLCISDALETKRKKLISFEIWFHLRCKKSCYRKNHNAIIILLRTTFL